MVERFRRGGGGVGCDGAAAEARGSGDALEAGAGFFGFEPVEEFVNAQAVFAREGGERAIGFEEVVQEGVFGGEGVEGGFGIEAGVVEARGEHEGNVEVELVE